MNVSRRIARFCLLLMLIAQTVAFEPRCGNCWCVPEGGTEVGECPSFEPGIWQSFPGSWSAVYATFQNTSSLPHLATANGDRDCFPFADSVEPQANYPESNDPPCVSPYAALNENTAVCGYKYVNDDTVTSCENREYELVTYDTMDALRQDGAHLVHSGICGVCSNPQDLAVRMSPLIDLRSHSISCGAMYIQQGRDFIGLVKCFQKAGFTEECAKLWGHFTATNSFQCAAKCFGQDELSGPPPTCPLSECLTCAAGFEAEFNTLAGVWKSSYNTGINDEIAYPCSFFTRVDDHDPCSGLEFLSPPIQRTPEPTKEPTSDAGLPPYSCLESAVAVLTLSLMYQFVL